MTNKYPLEVNGWPQVTVYGSDFRISLLNMANFITERELWNWMKEYSPKSDEGFMFSCSKEPLKKLNERKTYGCIRASISGDEIGRRNGTWPPQSALKGVSSNIETLMNTGIGPLKFFDDASMVMETLCLTEPDDRNQPLTIISETNDANLATCCLVWNIFDIHGMLKSNKTESVISFTPNIESCKDFYKSDANYHWFLLGDDKDPKGLLPEIYRSNEEHVKKKEM